LLKIQVIFLNNCSLYSSSLWLFIYLQFYLNTKIEFYGYKSQMTSYIQKEARYIYIYINYSQCHLNKVSKFYFFISYSQHWCVFFGIKAAKKKKTHLIDCICWNEFTNFRYFYFYHYYCEQVILKLSVFQYLPSVYPFIEVFLINKCFQTNKKKKTRGETVEK